MPTASDIRCYTRRTHAERLAARHACRARDIAGHWNGSWSARQWEDLLAEWNSTCYLCGEPLDPDDATPDHIVPLVRGGRNSISNLAPAHLTCNAAKGSKTLDEYRAYQAGKKEKTAMHRTDLVTMIDYEAHKLHRLFNASDGSVAALYDIKYVMERLDFLLTDLIEQMQASEKSPVTDCRVA